MRLAQWILLFSAIAGIAVLVIIARRKQGMLENGLPPRIVCVDFADALTRAPANALPILGTGSLAPYIPHAAAGLDPLKTVVALAVIDPSSTFDDIRAGTLCIYSADWTKFRVMHQASSKDALGWIGSGLNNAHSEAFTRITQANFVGIVSKVYVW